ncbi:MAG TPA: GNAT family N-acetyltransferase [Rhabdochlamydiaceae bacterium]|nr:GNAT family N-acetyltransferase [Rhabdochlamydiaceae bacterium]
MFKHHWWIRLILFWSIPGIFYGEQHDFQKNGIAYVWESEPNCLEFKKIFVDAHVKSYSKVPLDVLKMSSREEVVTWLEDFFEARYADYKNSKNHLWFSAKVNGKTVGLLVLDITKHPEEIYIALLAVAPAHQGRGIASSMIHGLFDQFSTCGKFVLNTRHANEEAKGFYKALGFVPSSYLHEGLNRELYTGFEYINRRGIE